MREKGQQEMVGFVLIVVIVIIAAMIFLIISVRKPAGEFESVNAGNMLTSMMEYTTDCAVVFEPQYDSIQDLIKSCFENSECSNLNMDSCDYLQLISKEVLDDMIKSESTLTSYELKALHIDINNQSSQIFKIFNGNCTGARIGASEAISTLAGRIITKLVIC